MPTPSPAHLPTLLLPETSRRERNQDRQLSYQTETIDPFDLTPKVYNWLAIDSLCPAKI